MSDALTTVRWDGDLTRDQLDEFLDRCCTVLAQSPRGVSVDLRSVPYMPSTLLGVLSSLSIEAKEQGKAVRVIVTAARAYPMRAVGLDKILEIVAIADADNAG